ncbi:MAG: hypothetical protein LUC39_02405 [Clostridiales bacterium]|nr:hypothetical protein [Clostridiales bacterium]
MEEYGEDREIYFYSYDWRKSNTDSAATLKESLDALGITKADFVCHSMGGLVASQFVAAYGESYIHTITTLGTPYEGATKLLNAVLTKHVLDNIWEDTILAMAGFSTGLKISFSGVAELAPTLESWTDTSAKNTVIVYSKEYSFKASDYMGLYTLNPPNEEMTTQDILDYLDDVINNSWLGWTIDGTGLLNKLSDVQAEIKADCGYTATKFYFGTTIYPIIEYKNDAESYSSALSTLFGSTLESKMETAKSGFTQLHSMDNAYFAIGNTKRTITGATLKVASNGTVSVQDLSYGLGDGTVPYQSANMLSDRVLSRASYFDLDHSQIGGGGDLEDNEEWQELTAWLKEIIDGGQPTGTTQSTESSSAYTKARVACPVDVTVTYNGETLSSCADSLCTETSFGTLDFAGSEGEIKILCLDTNADYEIVLTGTDEGSMEFGLSFYDENGDLIEEREVTDVPLTEDTVIYTTADPETETVLEIDTDGDAEIDDTVAVTEPIDPDTCEHEYEKTTIAPTCGYEGCDLYTCPLCGDFYIDNIIPATGEHVYSTTPEWAWATDHSAVTATFTCTGCGDAQAVDAVVTYEVTEAANSVSTGTAVYTATVTFDGETYTDTQTVTIPKIVLTAPTVTALFNSTYGITIRWEAIEGATEYIVWRLNNSTGRWERCATTTEPNYISTSPVSGTTYYYAIEATDGYTSTGRGPQRYIHYLATPKVSLENTSSGVKISWTKAGGAKSGYQIWRRTADSDYEQIGTVSSINTLTWTDETAALGVRYYYMVRSVSGSARSAYASQYITRLTAPTGISVSNVKNGVQVKWNAVTGAKSYQIWRKTPGGSWARVGSTSDTTYISTGVSSGNTYIFTVKAAYNSSVSAYNTTGKTIMRLAEPTIKLENLVGGLTASWNAVDGAKGYKLYRRSETGSYVLIADLGADELSYTDKAAKAGIVFYYRVQAYNGSYTSSWTSQFTRRIGHTTLTLTKNSSGVVLTWTESGGCTGYYIYRMNEDGSYTRIKTITSADTLTWTDTDVDLASGNAYTYIVRGYNGSSLGSYTPKKTSDFF